MWGDTAKLAPTHKPAAVALLEVPLKRQTLTEDQYSTETTPWNKHSGPFLSGRNPPPGWSLTHPRLGFCSGGGAVEHHSSEETWTPTYHSSPTPRHLCKHLNSERSDAGLSGLFYNFCTYLMRSHCIIDITVWKSRYKMLWPRGEWSMHGVWRKRLVHCRAPLMRLMMD